jgi:hypothetical protein
MPGLAAVVGFAVYCAIRGNVTQHVRGFQIAYTLAFAGYASLVWVVLRSDRPAGAVGRWGWWLAACVLVRLLLLHVVPSDDTYRYVWEGRIQGQGFNPFSYSPDAPELTHLRTDDWSRINHPTYRTIYPPLAQVEFLLVALISPSVYAVKVVHVLWDLATIVLLGWWCARRGHPPHRALIYGLCPLTLTAFAIDGHLDSLMLLCLVAGGLMIERERMYVGAVLIAAAIAAKIVAVVMLGWLAVRNWRAALLCVVCVAILYLPYASAGAGLFESLIRFVGGTAFFGLLHPVCAMAVGQNAARLCGSAVLVAVALRSVLRGHSFPIYGGVVLAVLILVAPIVHIWYLTWVLVFLPLRLRWSWLVLAAGMVFYFEAERARQLTGQWAMPAWAPFAAYGPFVVAWVAEAWVHRRADPPGTDLGQ